MDLFRQNSSARENLGLLAVMEALEEDERITQRELAKTTGLNLKKVNYCLHKLLEKGYVKFQRARKNPDKRAYLYILTPEGIRAKSQLTYEFFKITFDFYGKVERKFAQCLRTMAFSGVQRVVLYGASDVARILLNIIEGQGLETVGVVDDGYDGMEFHDVPIIKENQLAKLDWDGILITGLDNLEHAQARLMELGINKKSVWSLS